jgi:hypothetical protein
MLLLLLKVLTTLALPVVGYLIKAYLGVRKELGDLEKRLVKAESCLESVPSDSALHTLSLSIQELTGNLRVVGKELDGLEKIVKRVELVVGRHEEFLMKGGS